MFLHGAPITHRQKKEITFQIILSLLDAILQATIALEHLFWSQWPH